ncbi:MAG: hypothetical protein ACLR4Z_14955 [Butyricicoccaceae bacterium]
MLCGNVKLMEHSNIDLSGYHGTRGQHRGCCWRSTAGSSVISTSRIP